MEYRDYYATLGVPRGAGQAEIKKAFRKLARQYHPDVNKADAAAERRFKEVNEANAVLGDPQKRQAYDALGSNWEAYQRAQAGGGGGAGADAFAAFRTAGAPGFRFEYRGGREDLGGFSDFFRTFFAGGASNPSGAARGPSPSRRRGATAAAESVDFGDILAGLALDEPTGFAAGGPAPRSAPRERVAASGAAEISLEEAFHGTRRLVQVGEKRLEVTIPPGVDTGQKIRLSGRAGSGLGAGDVVLEVRVRPHPTFTRHGADLTRELPLTLAEALLGAEVPVATLRGRVLLRVPPETQNGRTFRLKGQGLPHFRREGAGDLLAKVRVVLPTDLDEEARRRFRAFADHHPQADPRAPVKTSGETRS